MNFKRVDIKACCGKQSTIYELGKTLSLELINSFSAIGFTELQKFTKAGILYIQNDLFILTGPIGSVQLQVKCRKNNCEEHLKTLEAIFENM